MSKPKKIAIAFKGLILFIIATVTSPVFNILGMIYSMFRFKRGNYWEEFGKHFTTLALSKDQLSNVALKHFFNDVMIKDKKPKIDPNVLDDYLIDDVVNYGNPDITISAVFGFAKKINNLTWFGRFWANFLNKLENNHVENAIDKEDTTKQ